MFALQFLTDTSSQHSDSQDTLHQVGTAGVLTFVTITAIHIEVHIAFVNEQSDFRGSDTYANIP